MPAPSGGMKPTLEKTPSKGWGDRLSGSQASSSSKSNRPQNDIELTVSWTSTPNTTSTQTRSQDNAVTQTQTQIAADRERSGGSGGGKASSSRRYSQPRKKREFRPPPDFRTLPTLNATSHHFTLQGSAKDGVWKKKPIKVKIDTNVFAEGTLRYCHHLQIVNEDGSPVDASRSYVAKRSKDTSGQDNDMYFKDVELQAHCRDYSDQYNILISRDSTLKKIQFLDAWVVEIRDGDGELTSTPGTTTLCGVEQFVPGEYVRHMNNYGQPIPTPYSLHPKTMQPILLSVILPKTMHMLPHISMHLFSHQSCRYNFHHYRQVSSTRKFCETLLMLLPILPMK